MSQYYNDDDEIRYDDPENVDKIPDVKDSWVADKIAIGSHAHGMSTGENNSAAYDGEQFQGPQGFDNSDVQDWGQLPQGYSANGAGAYYPSSRNGGNGTFYPGAGEKMPRSKLVAGIMGIFLGGLGIHNFYLGRTGRGIAQLLITVLSFGMLGIVSETWGIYEGIRILLSGPGDEWHRDGWGRELTD